MYWWKKLDSKDCPWLLHQERLCFYQIKFGINTKSSDKNILSGTMLRSRESSVTQVKAGNSYKHRKEFFINFLRHLFGLFPNFLKLLVGCMYSAATSELQVPWVDPVFGLPSMFSTSMWNSSGSSGFLWPPGDMPLAGSAYSYTCSGLTSQPRIFLLCTQGSLGWQR